MDICGECGASWECEHQPDPDRGRLVYVAPDSATYRQQLDAFAVHVVTVTVEFVSSLTECAEAIRRTVAAIDNMKRARSGAPTTPNSAPL